MPVETLRLLCWTCFPFFSSNMEVCWVILGAIFLCPLTSPCVASSGYISGSKCGPWSSSTGISWELVRNAHFEPYPRLTESETQVEAQQCVFYFIVFGHAAWHVRS